MQHVCRVAFYLFGAPSARLCPLCRASMSSSLGSTAFVVFAVFSVVTLKELNIQVNEPYMVRSQFCARHRVISTPLRMSPFTSHRSRHTATGTGPTGIRKSRHLPGCETASLGLFVNANMLRSAMFCPSYSKGSLSLNADSQLFD